MNQEKIFNQEDEINLSEILQLFWSSKFIIISIVFTFAVGSVFYSLSIPNKFTSSSTLIMIGESGQSMSGLGMLGSLPGLNIGISKGMNVVVPTIGSRDFLRHLLEFKDVKPVLAAFKEYDRDNKKIIFNKEVYDPQTELFTKDLTKMPSFQRIYDRYRALIAVSRDDKLGYMQVSVTHESPEFAFYLLSLIIDEINNKSRKKDAIESQASLDFLYKELTKTKIIEIRDSINKVITSVLKSQTMAEVKTDYIISPLDSPFFPELKSSPNRPRICILGTILGFFIGILTILIWHFGFTKRTK